VQARSPHSTPLGYSRRIALHHSLLPSRHKLYSLKRKHGCNQHLILKPHSSTKLKSIELGTGLSLARRPLLCGKGILEVQNSVFQLNYGRGNRL